MGRTPNTGRPSFFKILIKDYTSRLSLPPVFVQKYGKFLPESAKLRTSSGETWDVKLEETDDDDEEKYFFTGGWNKFVKDLELKPGEFLVFWFNIGESTFDISVYGYGGCEREISAEDLPAVDSDADDVFELSNDCHNVPDASKKRKRSWIRESEVAGTDSESGNLGKETRHRFEVVLTESHKSRLCIRKEFAEATGLIGKRAVVLEYPPKQRYWAVILDQRPRPYSSLDMAVGWNDFRKENGVMIGKTYSFEFDPTKNVIQVKEHKRRRTGRL